jgi:hypothetical protein
MCACHTFLLSTGSRASESLVSDMNQYANESGKACPITTVQACVHRVSEPSQVGIHSFAYSVRTDRPGAALKRSASARACA